MVGRLSLNYFVTFQVTRVTVLSLGPRCKYSIINKLLKYVLGFLIAIEKVEVLGMSLSNRVLAFALAAALAVVAGRTLLSATALQNAVTTVASAVWGS